MRQTDLADIRAQRRHVINRCTDCLLDFRLNPVNEVFFRHAHAQPADIAGQRRAIIRHRRIHAGAVTRIVPGNHAQQRRHILDRAPEYADLIQRRGKRDQTIARNTSV